MPRPSRSVDALLVGTASHSAFSSAMRALGYRSHEARDANAALALVVQAPVTVVILPLDVDGLETRELIARLRLGRPGVGVVLAAKPHEAGRIVSAWVQGFDGLVIEPPDERQLAETLERVVETANARMAAQGDAPLAQKLEETKRALDEERERVAKLRARVKKLEGSISGLSSEVRHAVKVRTQSHAALGVSARDGAPRDAGQREEPVVDDAKTSIYDDGASIRSGDPSRAAANHRARVPVESRMLQADAHRASIYDDEWSESSTAAAPIYATVEDEPNNDPAFRAPVRVDPFLDDVHDATDPADPQAVDVSAKKQGGAMKITELREELSDLLRPPGRRPATPTPPASSAAARPRARSRSSGTGSGSSSGKSPRARR